MKAVFDLAEQPIVNPEPSAKPEKREESIMSHTQTTPWGAVFKCPHCLEQIHVSAAVAISKLFVAAVTCNGPEEKVKKRVGQEEPKLNSNRGTGWANLKGNVKKQARIFVNGPNANGRGLQQKGPRPMPGSGAKGRGRFSRDEKAKWPMLIGQEISGPIQHRQGKKEWRLVNSVNVRGESSGLKNLKSESQFTMINLPAAEESVGQEPELNDRSVMCREQVPNIPTPYVFENELGDFEELESEIKSCYGSVNREEKMALVLVEDEVQAMHVLPGPEIEKILSLSLEGVDLVEENGLNSSIWVLENIQKFSSMMGIPLTGMEDYIFSFFTEIEKRVYVLKKEDNGTTKKRRKQSMGFKRELK